MPEDIQNLIEKIRQEGIQAAQDQARDIAEQARAQADKLLKKAEEQAQAIVARAQDKVSRMEQASRAALAQAGRDLILGLKEEINTLLNRLVVAELRQALKPQELIEIIAQMLKGASEEKKEQIIISLNIEDLKKIEKAIFSKLAGEAKKGITLKAREDIRAGFIISYDAGKSHFDFTDAALAEYIGEHLRPKLKDILEAAVKGKN